MDFDTAELIGYLASALVVLSLAMTSVVRLRTISLAGSVTFVVYGVLIGAVPIVITNVAIAVLNLWFLSRELGGRRDIGAVVVPIDSPFLADFLDHHADDVLRFQPDYDPLLPVDVAIVLTRDGLPAGAVLGRREDDCLDIELDYVLRAYRDSRIGRWLYDHGSSVFRSIGVTRVTTRPGAETHRAYLAKVGFEFDPVTHRFGRAV
jgi:GNAT superfamily N-acetyltransferase